MLSGELATLLSGRYITIDMLPLSFKEYCTAVGTVKTPGEHFNDYLRFGSFPYVSMLEHNDAIVTPYIDGIYNTILVKDVAKREGITYYQVSATVLDETTLTRELEPLQRMPDHHHKVLLTLDEIGAGTNYDGIKQVNLIDWLLSSGLDQSVLVSNSHTKRFQWKNCPSLHHGTLKCRLYAKQLNSGAFHGYPEFFIP